MKQMFTIGHSNHTIEHFVNLLITYGISAIADVRSSPYSEYAPQFNRELLQQKLQATNIEYVFLGRELGARRTEESCYVSGQAKYDAIRNLPAFRHGLDRVLEGIEQYSIALLCAEADPLACHRTILICPELTAVCPGLRINHILGDGSLESHEQAEQRLIRLHKLQPELFGELTSTSGLIERAYDLQAERIAYKKVPTEV
jgi:uncharacterized protein (DUF488 family)